MVQVPLLWTDRQDAVHLTPVDRAELTDVTRTIFPQIGNTSMGIRRSLPDVGRVMQQPCTLPESAINTCITNTFNGYCYHPPNISTHNVAPSLGKPKVKHIHMW